MDLSPDGQEQAKMDKFKFHLSDGVPEAGSSFLAMACKAHSLVEVNWAYRKVKQIYPAMDHITAVFRNKNCSGFQDDGEFGAGRRLSKLITDLQIPNTVVFSLRSDYGENSA